MIEILIGEKSSFEILIFFVKSLAKQGKLKNRENTIKYIDFILHLPRVKQA